MLNLLKQLDRQEREFFIPKNYEQTKKLVRYEEDIKISSRYRRSKPVREVGGYNDYIRRGGV